MSLIDASRSRMSYMGGCKFIARSETGEFSHISKLTPAPVHLLKRPLHVSQQARSQLQSLGELCADGV